MSQVAVFYIPLAGGEAQEEMNAFLRGHRVLRMEMAFTGNGWAFCVEWLDGSGAVPSSWKARKVDYREILEPEVFARFAKLRERRKAIAKEDGVPPYMVMTDAQMAEAAKPEKLTAVELKKIEGFGEARFEKYGGRLLDITGSQENEETPDV